MKAGEECNKASGVEGLERPSAARREACVAGRCGTPGSPRSGWSEGPTGPGTTTPGGNSVGIGALVEFYGWVEVYPFPGTRKAGATNRSADNGRSNRWKSGNSCPQALPV